MKLNDGEKSAVELEREKIAVESVTAEDKEKDKPEEKEDEKEETKEGEDDLKDEEDESEEDGEGEENEKEEKEDDPEKLKKTIERLQKRVAKKTGNEKELKKQLNEAQEALAKKAAEGEIVLTEEDVENRATTKAKILAAQKEFDDLCNTLAEDAKKIDKKFDDKIKELAEEVSPIPGNLIGMLGDLENKNGGAVLNYLTDHPEEYEEIIILSLPRQARRLDKISESLIVKKPKKEISKVPEPNQPLKPSNKSDAQPSDKDDMDTWVAKRNAQIARKRAGQG